LAIVPGHVYAQTQPASLPPITVGDKFRIHALRVITPDKWLGWAAYSGLQQLRNDPREWGPNVSGYGRRVASNAGYTAVRNVLGFGLDSTLHEDPRYYKSKRSGIRPRTADALRQIFIGHTDSGGERFAFSRFGSAYGTGFIAIAWMPKSASSAGDALINGTLSIAGDAGANVFLEFWPDIRKRLRRK
jgi:hypothetical protein